MSAGTRNLRAGGRTPLANACSHGSRRTDLPEAPLATREIRERAVEVAGLEIRPQAVEEQQFGVGAFEQQKIAQALFTAGPYQQIDFAGGLTAMIDGGELFEKPRSIDRAIRRQAPT